MMGNESSSIKDKFSYHKANRDDSKSSYDESATKSNHVATNINTPIFEKSSVTLNTSYLADWYGEEPITQVKTLVVKKDKKLCVVPESIGKFVNLTYLDLSGHDFGEFSLSISHLRYLQTLILANNNFYTLPNFLGLLQNLEVLGVSHNPLQALPLCLVLLGRLRQLNIDGCDNLVFPPRWVHRRGLSAILEFLSSQAQRRNLLSNQRFIPASVRNQPETLLNLCIDSIDSMSSVAFVASTPDIPNSVLRFLFERRMNILTQISLCKCDHCNRYFSSLRQFDCHVCGPFTKSVATQTDDDDFDYMSGGPEDRIDCFPAFELGSPTQIKSTQTIPSDFMSIFKRETTLTLKDCRRKKLDFNTIPLNGHHQHIGLILSSHSDPLIVTHLSLTKMHLSQLPESIEIFANLKELNLSKNKLTCLPQGMATLTKLLHLDLSYNAFTVIPTVIGQLDQLKSLNFAINRIQSLPTEILRLPRLQKLDVTGCWSFVDDTHRKNVYNFKEIESMRIAISLRYDKWARAKQWRSSAPETHSICRLFDLCIGTILDNGIDFMRSEKLSVQLKIDVKEFATHRACLCSVCNKICDNQKIFEAHFCRLKYPASITANTKTVPRLLSSANALQLRLGKQISDILNLPSSDPNLPYIDSNRETIEFTSGRKQSFSELEKTLQNVPGPERFGKFILINNELLSNLPVNIGMFINLVSLDVSNNYLSSLPWTLVYLKQLATLNMSNNAFVCIPKVVYDLKSLKTLDLSVNPIHILSNELLQLDKLENLHVRDCPNLEHPSQADLKQGWSVIKEHLADTQWTNAWSSDKPWYQGPSENSVGSHVKTLHDMCVECILSYDIDFADERMLPRNVKFQLMDKVRASMNKTRLYKCSACAKHFSRLLTFRTHKCVGARRG